MKFRRGHFLGLLRRLDLPSGLELDILASMCYDGGMIVISHKSMFETNADLLVCPVNTKGVMGAGLAKEFDERFPKTCHQYKVLGGKGQAFPGHCFIHTDSEENQSIAFLYTKDHWKFPSKIEWIHTGITNLCELIRLKPTINSVSIPALGCGCGKLKWIDVLPVIVEELLYFKEHDVKIMIHPPR